jgi:hypothetical protein
MISLLIAHSVPLSLYSILSQLHLAYKLAGAALHVWILFHPFDASYHHWNIECPSFLLGVQSDLIVSHSTKIIAPVHPFGWIVIDGDVNI